MFAEATTMFIRGKYGDNGNERENENREIILKGSTSHYTTRPPRWRLPGPLF